MRDLITNIETKTLQNAAVADGNGTIISITGLGTIAVQAIISGAGTTQVNFEVTVDNINWTAIKGTTVPATSSLVSTTIISGIFQFDVGGFLRFRARISNTIGVVSVTVVLAGVTFGTGGLSSETDTELETDDLDTGAGTDTQAIIGIALAENGGHALLGSAKPMPLIAGQTSITGAAGAVTANTPRITHASDDPVTTAVEIMDDWDESDRAKVNPVVGQAGIAAGTGVDGVTVPRISLATDIPLPAGSNAIGKLAANTGVDIGDVDVTSLPVGNVAMASSTPVTIASDDTLITALKTALETIDNMISGNEAQVDVITIPAPLNIVGGGAEAAALRVTMANNSTGVLSVDDNGGSLTVDQATHDNLNANANIQVNDTDVATGNPVPVKEQEACSMLFDSDGDNTAQVVKAAAGKLYGLEVSNPNATDAWIQLFDVAAGSVTVGTTTPNQSYLVPAGNGVDYGGMDKDFTIPINFVTAITYACTTTPTGAGNPTIGLIVNARYV